MILGVSRLCTSIGDVPGTHDHSQQKYNFTISEIVLDFQRYYIASKDFTRIIGDFTWISTDAAGIPNEFTMISIFLQ